MDLEKTLKSAMTEHRGNKSLMSVLLNTLLLYPDHPYGFEEIWAVPSIRQRRSITDSSLPGPETWTKTKYIPRKPRSLLISAKSFGWGAVARYMRPTRARKMSTAGWSAYVSSRLPGGGAARFCANPQGEEWYDRQLESGVEVVLCHPKLVETGLDLLAFPTLHFYQTGYSLHTLRQASRRSWRIGQRYPVRVKFLTYKGTMQEICLRLMGRKMLVALMMEGKFSGEGLQSLDADEDLMSAMARELVEKAGVGESADAVWQQLDEERSRQMEHDASELPRQGANATVDNDPALDLHDDAGICLVNSVSKTKQKDVPWPVGAPSERPQQPLQLSLFG